MDVDYDDSEFDSNNFDFENDEFKSLGRNDCFSEKTEKSLSLGQIISLGEEAMNLSFDRFRLTGTAMRFILLI